MRNDDPVQKVLMRVGRNAKCLLLKVQKTFQTFGTAMVTVLSFLSVHIVSMSLSSELFTIISYFQDSVEDLRHD